LFHWNLIRILVLIDKLFKREGQERNTYWVAMCNCLDQHDFTKLLQYQYKTIMSPKNVKENAQLWHNIVTIQKESSDPAMQQNPST
jgi:hypothetical protein